MDTMGARMNSTLLEPAGIVISLKASFAASAMGWSQPWGPTRFGPMRTWM